MRKPKLPFWDLALFISLAVHLFTAILKGSVFAMSGRAAGDLKLPELKDLVIALRDLVECHALGLQLGLPESTLKLIDKHPVEDHLRVMLSEWLQFDPEASWEKLATALNKIGKNAIAACVRREFLDVDADTQLTSVNAELASSHLSPPTTAPGRKASKEEGKGSVVMEESSSNNHVAQVVEQDASKRKL